MRELTEPSNRARTVTKQTVELPIGDGPHEVTVTLFGKNTTAKVEMPPMQVLSTTLNATVELPPPALAAAIEKAKATPK